MNKIKEYASLIFRSRLILTSSGRTTLKIPIWLAVILAIDSLRLFLLLALAVIGFGMNVSVEKG